eukprot:m.13301 g.13301  ORF g.13301 m.13301 type:complete len:916 (+) comp24648_c0_seq1:2443-5190(+)
MNSLCCRGFVWALCASFALFAGGVFAQDCNAGTKPNIKGFGISPADDVQINGTFSGDMATCHWYVDGRKNTTTKAKKVTGTTINCPLPAFLLKDRDDDLTGTPPMAANSSDRVDDFGVNLEVAVQVYYTSGTNNGDQTCYSLSTIITRSGMTTIPTSVSPGSDCGTGPCFSAYNKSTSASKGNITLICAAAHQYLTCLKALPDCTSNPAYLDGEIKEAWRVLKVNPCLPMTPTPSVKPTPRDVKSTTAKPMATVKPTRMPASGKDLMFCCRETAHDDSVDGKCQTICAMTFPDSSKPGNKTLLPKLEMVCRMDKKFEMCVRKQISTTIQPTVSTAEFFKDIRDCCQDDGSSECQGVCKNLASGSVDEKIKMDVVEKCVRQGNDDIRKCFVEVVEEHFDIEVPSEDCCNGSKCMPQCQKFVDQFWSIDAFSVTDPHKLALKPGVEVLRYQIFGACSSDRSINNGLSSCLYDGDNDDDDKFVQRYYGPDEDTVMKALITCCNRSLTQTRACGDICDEILDQGDQSPQHILACFTPNEAKFVQCVAEGSGDSATGLRSFFRNLVGDRDRGKDLSSCCDRASGDTCENLCLDVTKSKMMSNKTNAWMSSCKNNLNQGDMLECLSNIKYGKCAEKCNRLDFCSNFNNRPYEYRLEEVLCGPVGDSLAAALHGSWIDNGAMSLHGTAIKMKDVQTCDADFFKSLACFLIAQPCQDSNDLSLLCEDQCVAAFDKCKATNEAMSSLAICRTLGASRSQCWNLNDFSGPPSAVKQFNFTVSVILPTWTWSPLLNLLNTPDYSDLADEIELNVEKMFAHLPGKQSVRIIGFEQTNGGKVRANFTVISRGSNPASLDILRGLLQTAAGGGATNSRLGDLQIAGDSLLLSGDFGDSGPTDGAGMVSASYAIMSTLLMLAASLIFGQN